MLTLQGWFNLLIYATFTRITYYRSCNLHSRSGQKVRENPKTPGDVKNQSTHQQKTPVPWGTLWAQLKKRGRVTPQGCHGQD